MLEKLKIKNYALIKNIEIDFSSGLNILTGETGAGKSIIIGALNIAIGERGYAENVRTGEDKAEIEAVFNIKNNKILHEKLEETLKQSGIIIDDERLIIKREINKNGKGKISINNTSAGLNILEKTGNYLVDIHGQHEHQSLLKTELHIEFLDAYAKTEKLRNEISNLYSKLIIVNNELKRIYKIEKEKQEKLARDLNISLDELEKRAADLHESNPMMGHRGVRLGVTYPEISRMQIRAILEASAELLKEGKKPYPEIMIPVVSLTKELEHQKAIADEVYQEVLKKHGLKEIKYLFGTMIEIPRACLVANEIAGVTDFFSFGTNDLTQMGFGFSRDDIGSFVPDYIEKKILPEDPFQTIDQVGIGELIQIGIERGRKTKPNLEIGICGEHGGEPRSVKFCHRVGMDYVSCSPFRVPIARLAAAQAVAEEKTK